MGRYAEMKLLPGNPITGPCLWYASDLQRKPELFVYKLTDRDIQELDEAVAAVAASHKDLKVSSSHSSLSLQVVNPKTYCVFNAHLAHCLHSTQSHSCS